MNSNNNNIPSAWVWSEYKGDLSAHLPEIPLAWVWSQYQISAPNYTEKQDVENAGRMYSKIIYAAAAIVIFIMAAIYKESNEVYASHDLTNNNISDSYVSKALDYLREAYKISPREETEKLINQVEKINRNKI